MVSVPRSPLITRIGPVPDRAGVPLRSQEGVRVNLLVNTLKPIPGNPNYDWPNPRGPGRPIDLRTWSQTRNSDLVDTFFGLAGNPNFDWPNPRGAQRGVDLRWFGLSENIALYTTVPDYLTAGYPNYDWPNPRGFPGRNINLRWFGLANLALSTSFPTLTAGWPKYDWPVPAGPKRTRTLYTWTARPYIATQITQGYVQVSIIG